MNAQNYNNIFEGLEKDPEFLTESTIVEFTEDMAKRMAELGITRSELARRLDTSPAYITKILQGNANFTLKSMVRISLALESKLTTHLQPDGAQSQWFDFLQHRKDASPKHGTAVNVDRQIANYHSVHVPANSEEEPDDSVPSAA